MIVRLMYYVLRQENEESILTPCILCGDQVWDDALAERGWGCLTGRPGAREKWGGPLSGDVDQCAPGAHGIGQSKFF